MLLLLLLLFRRMKKFYHYLFDWLIVFDCSILENTSRTEVFPFVEIFSREVVPFVKIYLSRSCPICKNNVLKCLHSENILKQKSRLCENILD